MNTVYVLIDPCTKEARYVGMTEIGLGVRLSGHMSGAASAGVSEWASGLKAKGLKPEIHALETHDDADEANESEEFWISALRGMGANLLNVRRGGKPRRDLHREYVSVQFALPPDLHIALKLIAIDQRSTLRQVIIDTLQSAVK